MRNVLFGITFIFITGCFLAQYTGNKEYESILIWSDTNWSALYYLLFKSNSDKYIIK